MAATLRPSRKRQLVSALLLGCLLSANLATQPPPIASAAPPGPRSATVSGEVFLGGHYIELGISAAGSFGTTGARPTDFYGTAVRSQIGMSSDIDGFNTGSDLRMDYFMPGSPEERWVIGYKVGGSTVTASNASRQGVVTIPNSVVNTSSGNTLAATSTGTHGGRLEIVQKISFQAGQKYFGNQVTLKNVSASDTLNSVRYMRSFDPDNTVDRGGSYTTINTIKTTYAADGYACVEAKTSSTTDPIFTATGSRAPVLLCSTDSRARASAFGFSNDDPYNLLAYDAPRARGYTEMNDGAITLAFDVGTLAPGQSTTLTYYTSLDERDFYQVIDEITRGPVTVNPLTTTDMTPPLSGTVLDSAATVTVTVNGTNYTATNNGDGTWSLADNVIAPPLIIGTYSVTAVANGPAGLYTDTTTDELKIVTGITQPPAVAVPDLITNDTTPRIVGSVSAPDATVSVVIATKTYTPTNNGNGSWTLPDNTIAPPLADGRYNVAATATNLSGSGTDSTTNELWIDTIAPDTSVVSPPSRSNRTSIAIDFSGVDSGTGTGVARYECRLDGGSWSVCTAPRPLSGLTEGSHTFDVRATDRANNTDASPASATWFVDLTAPAAPTITTPAAGALVAVLRPVISGTTAAAEVGGTVTVREGGTTYCVATIAADGSWSCTPTVDLAQGTRTITAFVTDQATNISSTTSRSFTVDTVAPAAPVYTSPTVVNTQRPTIAGTAESGATVTLGIDLDNNGSADVTYTTTATGGTWSVNLVSATPASGSLPTAGLPEGNVGLQARATDAAGNNSTRRDRALTVDLTAPAAPTFTSPALATQRRPVISGTAEAGSTLMVGIDLDGNGSTDVTYTLTVPGGGAWSINTASATPSSGTFPASGLNDGSYGITARVTDPAGNIGANASQMLTIDATAPVAPTFTSPALTNQVRPTLSGTAEAGSTLTVGIDLDGVSGADVTYTLIVPSGGAWSVNTASAAPSSGTFPASGLSEQSYAVTARATDAAGNIGTSASQTLTIDTTAPAAPTFTSPALTNQVRPTLSGTAEAGSTLTVGIDLDGVSGADVTYTLVVPSGGTWSVNTASATPSSGTFPASGLSDGNYAVSAATTDAAGNPGPSASQTLSIDAAAPALPVMTSPALTNQVRPTLSGTAEAGSTLTVGIDLDGVAGADVTYTLVVPSGGAWSVNTASAIPSSGTFPASGLTDGSYAVSAAATDAAGNASPVASQTLTVDTTAPAAPTFTSPALTNQVRPTLSGTAEAGSTLTVGIDLDGVSGADVTYTLVVPSGGAWSINTASATPSSGTFPASGLSDGSYAVSAAATDPAGNAGPGVSQTLTVDTTAPATPSLTSPAATSQPKPTLSGTADAGSTLTVGLDLDGSGGADVTYVLTVPTNGIWTVDLATATPSSGTFPASGLSDGSYAVSASAADAAGNITSPTSQTLTVDTVAPAAPTFTSPALTNQVRPTLSGTAEAGSTLTVGIDLDGVAGADVTYTLIVPSSGAWTLDTAIAAPSGGTFPVSGLAEGTYAVTAAARDAAGNTSAVASQSLVVDRTTPTAPTFSSPALTNQVRPTLSGTAEAGSTLTVGIDLDGVAGADVTYTLVVPSGGAWTLDTAVAAPSSGALPSGGLSDGNYLIDARATDPAGNTGLSTSQTLTVDATAPALPAITSPALTNQPRPALSGSAEAGSTLQIGIDLDNNGSVDVNYSLAVPSSGLWSLDTATALAINGTFPVGGLSDGSYGISVRATDAVGNTGPIASQTLTVDASAPAAPTFSSPALTNQLRPTFSGSAEPGSRLTLEIDLDGNASADVSYTLIVPSGGAWSLDTAAAAPSSGAFPAVGLNDGSYTITARVADAAGNAGPSSSQSLSVDTSAPVTPTITNAALTNQARPTFRGSAEAGSTLTVGIDLDGVSGADVTYTLVVPAGGAWTLDTATATSSSGLFPASGLSDGSYTVTAYATDAAGNAGANVGQTLTIDTAPPGTPTFSSPTLTNQPRPTFSGTAEVGSTVTVGIDLDHNGSADVIYTLIVPSGGAWNLNTASATPSSGTLPAAGLADGSYTVTARATDPAGNAGPSMSQSVLVDASAPATPTIDSAALTNQTRPTISGTAEAGSTLTVGMDLDGVAGAEVTYTLTVPVGGVWSINTALVVPSSGTFPAGGLSAGTYAVSVTAGDLAGNTSPVASQSLVIDPSVPTPPTPLFAPHGNVRTPVLNGTADAGNIVQIGIDLNGDTTVDVRYDVQVGTDGTWSVDLSSAVPTSGTLPAGGLVDGSYAIRMTASNAAGTSSGTSSRTLTVDTVAPPAVNIPATLTRTIARPAFSGTAEAGATVRLGIDTDRNGTPDLFYTVVATTPGGAWSIDLTNDTPSGGTLPAAGLADGTYPLTVVATDLAGNSSPTSSASLRIDTTPPTAPVITEPAAGAPVRALPTFRGTAEPDSIVTITIDRDGNPATTADIVTFTTTADGNGNWRIDTATQAPASGVWDSGFSATDTPTYTVSARDASGNITSSPVTTVQPDTVAPQAPVIAPMSGLLTRKPVVRGTAEPGSTVLVTFDPDNDPTTPNELSYSVLVDSNGEWRLDTATVPPLSGTMPTDGLRFGDWAGITARVRDAAGNFSSTTTLRISTGTRYYIPLFILQK